MTNHTETPLESWKEIGAYLQRDSTTARRWEKEEGLPVHRHSHKSRSSVYAYPSEIDAWRASRKAVPEPEPPRPLWKMPAFALTMALCLVMVGNGLRPQAASAQGSAPVARQVGEWYQSSGWLSADGRYYPYTDWTTGDLALRDVITGSSRTITDVRRDTKYGDSAEGSAISPDNRQVVFQHFIAQEGRYRLQIVNVQGADRKPRNLIRDQNQEAYVEPKGWTPDGKQVLVVQQNAEKIWQIAMVSVADGSVRVVKSLQWGRVEANISPDGRYVAYDTLVEGQANARDIFVLATDGSRETAVVRNPANDSGMTWSPDGSELLFLSDRTGKQALWAVPMKDGKPAGDVNLVKADFEGSLLGVGKDGILYYQAATTQQNIYRAELNADGKVTKPPVIATDSFLNSNRGGAVSPDGQSIAYYSFRPQLTVVVRSLRTGEERVIPTKLTIQSLWNQGPKWLPDGRGLMVVAREINQPARRLHRIDVATGKEEELIRGISFQASTVGVASNGFYTRTEDIAGLMHIDPANGHTRVIVSGQGTVTTLSVSPDGKRVAYVLVSELVGEGTGLGVAPTSGGEPRIILLRGTVPVRALNALQWTSDQQHLLFVRQEEKSGQNTIFRIPAEGGEAESIGVTMQAGISSLFAHPDGKSLFFTGAVGKNEVWALENFVPAAAK